MKRLYWDVETSPNVVLSWRVGYDLKIDHDNILEERKLICIGYKWDGESKATVITWDKNQNDYLMLKHFLGVANEADELVAHYGDRFDLPWFKTRCLIHGFDPLPTYKTIDTKAWASKYFYFNSAKLDYLGDVLGYGKKIETDFKLWKDIVLKDDRSALAKMAKYCGRDIDLLEKVHKRLEGCVKPKTHAGVLVGHAKWSCPFCGEDDSKKSKTRVSSSGTITHQMKCCSCKKYHVISDSVYKSKPKKETIYERAGGKR